MAIVNPCHMALNMAAALVSSEPAGMGEVAPLNAVCYQSTSRLLHKSAGRLSDRDRLTVKGAFPFRKHHHIISGFDSAQNLLDGFQ